MEKENENEEGDEKNGEKEEQGGKGGERDEVKSALWKILNKNIPTKTKPKYRMYGMDCKEYGILSYDIWPMIFLVPTT
jgi:hypothetical protein